jgi:hypothetical protein
MKAEDMKETLITLAEKIEKAYPFITVTEKDNEWHKGEYNRHYFDIVFTVNIGGEDRVYGDCRMGYINLNTNRYNCPRGSFNIKGISIDTFEPVQEIIAYKKLYDEAETDKKTYTPAHNFKHTFGDNYEKAGETKENFTKKEMVDCSWFHGISGRDIMKYWEEAEEDEETADKAAYYIAEGSVDSVASSMASKNDYDARAEADEKDGAAGKFVAIGREITENGAVIPAWYRTDDGWKRVRAEGNHLHSIGREKLIDFLRRNYAGYAGENNGGKCNVLWNVRDYIKEHGGSSHVYTIPAEKSASGKAVSIKYEAFSICRNVNTGGRVLVKAGEEGKDCDKKAMIVVF